MSVEVKIPSVGESISEVTIAEWVKKNGDSVSKGDVLLVLETDKASVEINAEESGQLSTSKSEGDTVEVGAVVGAIDPSANGNGSDKMESSATEEKSADSSSKPDSKPTATGDPVDIKIPEAGESITEVTIAEWAVSDGDFVNRDDVIMTLETDKASMDINAESAGIVNIKVDAGETVAVGTTVGTLTPAEGGAPAKKKTSGSEKKETQSESSAQSESSSQSSQSSSSTSGSARVSREATLDRLSKSSSPKETTSSSAPTQSPAPASRRREPGAQEEEVVKMTPIRKTIARRLKEVQNTAAILTTFNEVDLTAAMALRKQYQDEFVERHGVKLGLMSLFIKACIEGLKEFPAVNGRIDGENLIYNHYYNIGVAVSTEKGLMVPVIKEADRLSLAEIELEIKAFAEKARAGKISMDDLSRGTFSVTNGGVFGSMMSTPILNPPQSGILGMHSIMDRPVAIDGKVEVRKMMYIALSYDHRIIDGREAVSFLVKVKKGVEDPQRLLIHV